LGPMTTNVCRKDAEGVNRELSKLLISPSNWAASHSTTPLRLAWHGGVLEWRSE
jgi:hypothetical protein